MPEWQGAGVGIRFLNGICEMYMRGENKWGKPLTTVFHTSHPGLVSALRRDPRWRQVSAALYGANKVRSHQSLTRSGSLKRNRGGSGGFGGHFRAIQGFRFHG